MKSYKKVISIFIVLICIIGALPVLDADISNQRTIYVDDDNTTGPWFGTEEYPFMSIAAAVFMATDGDIISVKSGDYSEPLIYINHSISLIGEHRDSVMVRPIELFNISGIFINENNVEITGFTFNKGYSIILLDENFDQAIHDIKLNENTFYSFVILLFYKSHSIDISNNIFYGYESGLFIALLDTGSNIITSSNTFEETDLPVEILTLYSTGTPIHIIHNNFINNINPPTFYYLSVDFFDDTQFKKFIPDIVLNSIPNGILKTDENKIRKNLPLIPKFPVKWDQNYMDDWSGFGPYMIKGLTLLVVGNYSFPLPIYQCDWHPARESYIR